MIASVGIYSTTYDAAPTCSPIPPNLVGGIRQRMSLNTVGLAGVDGRWTPTSEQVVFLWPELYMGGVRAPRIVTDHMIQNGDAPPPANGQRRNQPGIHQPMDALCPAPIVEYAVPSVSDLGTGPVPAASLRINDDLRPYTPLLALGEVNDQFHGKIISYAEALCQYST
jgi:hypothetical protein